MNLGRTILARAAVAAVVIVSGSGTLGTAAANNTLTKKEEAEGWRLLFDGKTTDGWRGYRKVSIPDGWKIVDGALTRAAAASDIVTIDQFADFELKIDWNISPNGDSGIFYRVSETEDVAWKSAPEFQVIDNAAKGLKAGQLAGANYDLHPPSRDVTRPVGSWNEARIVARGPHVEHWLNGVKIVEYELWNEDWESRVKASQYKEFPLYARKKQGHIGLRDQGERVAYRNIKIRELK